jgi:hypothetical protein
MHQELGNNLLLFFLSKQKFKERGNMGLDIDYFKNPEFLIDHIDPDEDYGDKKFISRMGLSSDQSIVHVFAYKGLAEHLAPFPLIERSPQESSKIVYAGFYTAIRIGRFHAGSYSGYNMFREQLCNQVLGIHPETIWEHFDEYKSEPFAWLINFADNEGCIGPEKCAILREDFASHTMPEKWNNPELNSWNEFFVKQWNNWNSCFQEAELVEFG